MSKIDRNITTYKSYKEKFFELTYEYWKNQTVDRDCNLLLRRDINLWLELDKNFGLDMHEETMCYIWYTKALEKLFTPFDWDNIIYSTIIKTATK